VGDGVVREALAEAPPSMDRRVSDTHSLSDLLRLRFPFATPDFGFFPSRSFHRSISILNPPSLLPTPSSPAIQLSQHFNLTTLILLSHRLILTRTPRASLLLNSFQEDRRRSLSTDRARSHPSLCFLPNNKPSCSKLSSLSNSNNHLQLNSRNTSNRFSLLNLCPSPFPSQSSATPVPALPSSFATPTTSSTHPYQNWFLQRAAPRSSLSSIPCWNESARGSEEGGSGSDVHAGA